MAPRHGDEPWFRNGEHALDLVRMAWISGLALATAAALVVMLFRQRAITALGGCGTGDGLNYCAVANGRTAKWPFSHRPLVPLVARLIHLVSHLSVPHSFLVVALAGFVLAAVTTAALGGILAERAGLDRRRTRWVAIAASAAWAVSPFGLRFALLSPVLTDGLATALLVSWLVVAIRPPSGRYALVAAPLLAFLATLARETSAATIVLTCVVAFACHVVPVRTAIASGGAALLAFVFDVTRPARPNARYVHDAWHSSLSYWSRHPGATTHALLMGVGVALIALLPTTIIRLRRRMDEPEVLAPLLTAMVVPILLSAGGLDLPRLSSPAAPIGSAVLAVYAVGIGGRTRTLVLLAIGTAFLFEWRIFGVIARTQKGYTGYFLGRRSFGAVSLTLVAALVVALLVIDARSIRAERDATAATSRA